MAAALGTSLPVLALDDNLVNGQTYTFQFQLANLLFSPDTNTVLNDLYTQAPDFLTSVGVTFSEGLSSYFMNVQFTYEGDGSDVVSDVASAMVAAFLAGSNDSFTFVNAFGSPAASVTVPADQTLLTPAQAVTSAGTAAVGAAGTVAASATSAAGGVVNSALSGLLPLLAIAVILVLVLAPTVFKGAKIANPV